VLRAKFIFVLSTCRMRAPAARVPPSQSSIVALVCGMEVPSWAARDINDGQLLIEPLDGRNIQTTLPGEHNCWKKAPSKEIQLPPREDWRGCTNSVEERLDVNAPR
jgi:hypothetical protein